MSRVALFYITAVRFPFIHLQMAHIYIAYSPTSVVAVEAYLYRVGSVAQSD